MNKSRLLRLAKLLEQDAANPAGIKFDLSTWAERLDKDEFPKRLRKLDCKTQACAVGLACLSGAFKKDGLHWKPMEDNNILPLYAGQSGFEAVSAFFEITPEQAMRLFVDGSYDADKQTGRKGELAVAKRLRNFVS